MANERYEYFIPTDHSESRRSKLREAAAELDTIHSHYGSRSQQLKFKLLDYTYRVMIGRPAALASGMSSVPHDKMFKANTVYMSLINGDEPFHGFTWKQNESGKKRSKLTIHDYTGENADGEHVPFSYFVTALISGKTKEFTKAQRKEARAHVTAVESPEGLQPGELSFDAAISDDNADNLEHSRYYSTDGELQRRLNLHELEYIDSDDFLIARRFLWGGVGNFSEIARMTGIDRRRVAASIRRYIDTKFDIVTRRQRELGHDDSDAAIKRILGIGGAKSHTRGHVVETWSTRRKDPEYVDNGWNGYKIGPGSYSEDGPA